MFGLLKFKINSSKLLKTYTKNKLFSVTSKFKFSTSQAHEEVFPDEIVDHLKQLVNEKSTNEHEWNELDYNITDKIHFFDADQYTDIVFLLCQHSQITDNLWDLLSRKVFDYELNEFQTIQLSEAFPKAEGKILDNAFTPIIRNLIYLKQNKQAKNYIDKILH